MKTTPDSSVPVESQDASERLPTETRSPSPSTMDSDATVIADDDDKPTTAEVDKPPTSSASKSQPEPEVIIIDDDDDDDNDGDNDDQEQVQRTRPIKLAPIFTPEGMKRTPKPAARRKTSKRTPNGTKIQDGIIGMKVRSPTNA